MSTTSTDQLRAFVGVRPFRVCDVTAYPLIDGPAFAARARVDHGDSAVRYKAAAGFSVAEMAAEMRAAERAREAERARVADLPTCTGCGRPLTYETDVREWTGNDSWYDDDARDEGVSGRVCDETDSGVHEVDVRCSAGCGRPMDTPHEQCDRCNDEDAAEGRLMARDYEAWAAL